MPKQTIVLNHKFALGDTVCLTALARDIERAYPGRYDITHISHFRNMWINNPYSRAFIPNEHPDKKNIIRAKISYREGIKRAGRGERLHMLRSYHDAFEQITGIHVPLTEPKGDIHLTEDEKKPIIDGKYWILNAGGKKDATVKVWRPKFWQRVVDMLREHGIWCVQSGVRFSKHFHPTLNNVIDAVDHHDDARMLCNMIMHAEGVLCPITAMMHIAAVYDTPCVVVAGGREEPWWEQYSNDWEGAFGPDCAPVKTPHRYLHTIGQLDCCKTKGCWKHRTVPLGIRDHYDDPHRLCKLPTLVDGVPGPKCLDLITPEQVVEAVLSYGTEPGEKPERAMDDVPLIPGLSSLPKKPLTATKKVPKIVRKGNRTPAVKPAPPVKPVPSDVNSDIIGGQFTAFVLCYGDHTELAKSCLTSILDTTPPDVLDIRVICHEVVPETMDYLRSLPLTKIYDHKKNRGKYVSMREAFNDPDYPINTNYVLWFDDDTKIVKVDWLQQLSRLINTNHPHGNRMYGTRYYHDVNMFAKNGNNPKAWFESADWWKGRHMRVRGKQLEAPNGSQIEFAVGYFWALATETIRLGNIPDARLNHNGGDITIGEQVHQVGGKIASFNVNKQYVWCPKKEQGGRRGYSEQFPWSGR